MRKNNRSNREAGATIAAEHVRIQHPEGSGRVLNHNSNKRTKARQDSDRTQQVQMETDHVRTKDREAKKNDRADHRKASDDNNHSGDNDSL